MLGNQRKPNTSLGDPWPAPTILPRLTQIDDCGEYESELAVITGKQAKNVSESAAMEYVLGYTAANDVSSRTCQLNQSQWSFSKGFDGACPLGQFPLRVRPCTILTQPFIRTDIGVGFHYPRTLQATHSRYQKYRGHAGLSAKALFQLT